MVVHVGAHGVDTSAMEREDACAGVRRTAVSAGEVLVEAGSSPSFVHVPLTAGLEVRPTGGYTGAAAPSPPATPAP